MGRENKTLYPGMSSKERGGNAATSFAEYFYSNLFSHPRVDSEMHAFIFNYVMLADRLHSAR